MNKTELLEHLAANLGYWPTSCEDLPFVYGWHRLYNNAHTPYYETTDGEDSLTYQEWFKEVRGVRGKAMPSGLSEDQVNHPSHYGIFKDLEAIDIIKKVLTPEEFNGYLKGNYMKYRLRAGNKDNLQQDISKSEWYRNYFNGL